MKRLIAALTFMVVIAALFSAAAAPAKAQQTNTTYYTVQPGDDLYRIGLKFNVPAAVIAQANGIVNTNMLFVGQRLVIPLPAGVTVEATGAATAADTGAVITATPEATMTASATVETAATAAATGSPTPEGAMTVTTYTVQPGDNLYRISLKFNTTMAVLIQLNNLPNANFVYVGQVLKLPPNTIVTPTPTPGATTATPMIVVVTNTAPPPTETIVPTEGPSPTPIIMIVTNTAPVPSETIAPTATIPPTPTVAGVTLNTASNVPFAYGIQVGISPNTNPASVGASVTDLGLSWVKLPVSWKDYEATKGNIDYTNLDAYVNQFANSNVKILMTVSKAPNWARQTTAEDGPPSDNTDYANFVSALASHYLNKVQAFEIWSEPNIRREWNGKPLSAAGYAELLRVAYTAIKAANPNALVLSAGLAPTGYDDGVNAINDRLFLQQAYASGLAAYSDAIGAHPQGWANPPDSTCCAASPGVSGWFNDRSFYFQDTLTDYRKIMSQNNDGNTFIWVTDFGWGSSDGVVADQNSVNSNLGYVRFLTQSQQGQYNTRAFELGKAMSFVGPMFLSNLNYCQVVTSSPSSSTYEPCFTSLLDPNGNPRAAYTALKAVPKQ